MTNRFEQAASFKNPEEFTRHALAALESELRRVALLGLQDWSRTKIVSPAIFQSLCSLQRPSWGTWNGLITSLRTARKEAIRNGTPEERKKAEQTNTLAALLKLYDQSVDPELTPRLAPLAKAVGGSSKGSIKWGRALTMPITLRNRIAHDNPTEPSWWTETSRALLPLILTLASENPFHQIAPANGKYTSPWFGTQKRQVLAFNGIDQKSAARYVNDKGVSIASEKGGGQVLRVLQNLMGKTDMQESDYRKLMGRLAPQEVKGVLLEDFLVGKPVGEGGFATVHVGRQLSTGRQVAIKILRDAMSEDAKLRFQQEAAFLARLQHPNIVSAISYGEGTWSPPRSFKLDEPWFKDKFKKTAPVKTFIALEWVDGKTLDEYFRHENELDFESMTRQFCTAARAMQTVHDAKMIHRDIKPSNLMITQDGQLKVMDFGIARSDHEDRTLQTQTGQTVGTPAYMSPEQLRAVDADSEVGPATDVYSLCATFYELYTGKRIFAHDTTPSDTVRSMKLGGVLPERPTAEPMALPWEIETLLIGGLQPELSDRVPTMQALADDLERVLSDRPIQYRRPSLSRRLQLVYRRNKFVVNVSGIAAATVAAVALIALLLISAANMKTQTAEQGREKQAELAKSRGVSTSLLTAYREQENGNLGLAQKSLDEISKQDRNWEWFYLDQVINSDKKTANVRNLARTTTNRNEFGNVVDVAYNDGRCFSAFKSGKHLTIFDVSNSKKVSDITASGGINLAHLSADGKRAYTNNAYGFEVFDTISGKPVIQLPRDTSWQEVLFDRGLQNYAIRSKQGILINHGNPSSAGRQTTIQPSDDSVKAMTFSRDGTLLATVSDIGTLQIWDVRSGNETFSTKAIKTSYELPDRNERIEFSSNNKWIRVNNVLLNLARKKQTQPIVLPTRANLIRFIPNRNQLLAVTPANRNSEADRIHLFDVDGSESKFTTCDSGLSLLKVAFSPNGRQVALPGDDSIVVFDTSTLDEAYELSTSRNSEVAFSSTGNELATAYEFETKIFDAAKGQSDLKLDYSRIGKFIDVVPDKNQFFSTSGFWSIESPKLQRPIAASLAGRVLAVSNNGRWLAASARPGGNAFASDIQVVDLEESPSPTITLSGLVSNQTLAIEFSEDGTLVAAVTNNSQLKVFDSTDGRLLKTFDFEADELKSASIVISPDNSKIAIGLTIGMVKVWDLTNGREVSTPTTFGRSKLVRFSPDSRELATLAGTIFNTESGGCRNLENGAQVTNPTPRSSSTGTLAFLADGSRLMISDADSISIREPTTGREMLKLPIGGVMAAEFSSDGRYLIVQTVSQIQVLDAGQEFKLGPTFDSKESIAQAAAPSGVAPREADFSIPADLKKSTPSRGGDYEDPELGVTYFIPRGVTIRPTALFRADKIRSLPRGKERKNMYFDSATDEVDFISVMQFYEKVPEYTLQNASMLTDVGAAIAFQPMDFNGKQIPLFELESNSNGRTRVFAVVIQVGDESFMVHALGPSSREPKLKKYISDVMESIRNNSDG